MLIHFLKNFFFLDIPTFDGTENNSLRESYPPYDYNSYSDQDYPYDVWDPSWNQQFPSQTPRPRLPTFPWRPPMPPMLSTPPMPPMRNQSQGFPPDFSNMMMMMNQSVRPRAPALPPPPGFSCSMRMHSSIPSSNNDNNTITGQQKRSADQEGQTSRKNKQAKTCVQVFDTPDQPLLNNGQSNSQQEHQKSQGMITSSKLNLNSSYVRAENHRL